MCSQIAKILFIIINILVALCALAFTVVGALLAWGQPTLKLILNKAIENISNQTDPNTRQYIDLAIDRIFELGYYPGIAIFVFGLSIFCLTVIGFIGACCNIKCMLIVYSIIVGLIFLIHLILIIVYFAKKNVITDALAKFVKTEMDSYVSLANGDVHSITAAFIMQGFKCCGATGSSDFQTSTSFSREDTVRGHHFIGLPYPVACCIKEASLQPGVCPMTFTPNNSYINRGCIKSMNDDLLVHMDQVVLGSLVLLALTGLLFALAVTLIVTK
ncbi:hypothetical protein EG68_00481 [Paragonimus skrjabini miyazakii]|uniref:Tetraspanin n=1 Tax=Paragonimus skrjabini miyazakii TaxID=59628 RepID=A0A8S9Z952_9TREM|nr:hypothetical protein EG68_00481 [Paragonimus skrjabini miyazakii]